MAGTIRGLMYPTQLGAAVIYFTFLNGAMSTSQCEHLTSFFHEVSSGDDAKVIVLAGGKSAWSNGINLNTIEASSDAAKESRDNINAINDFVKAIFPTNKITIAALQGNAGAGRASMAALACDSVWTHEKAILNPHYKSMGVFMVPNIGRTSFRNALEMKLPINSQKRACRSQPEQQRL